MARVRPRPLIAALAVTLLVSALVGFVLSRGDEANDTVTDGVQLDTPGTFDEPSGGIPTAPDIGGETLPDVTVQSLDGSDLSLADLTGQPLVVNLWYSTCVPCKKELPDFAAVHQELGDEVRFVGLNLQDSADRAERFARDAGVGYEILLDPDQQTSLALDIAIFPSTLFVDSSGRIVELHQGALTADELRALIAETLTA
ncbi:MAG: TlpA family protein disulfide reductase [Acidimicrobiia bacterium]